MKPTSILIAVLLLVFSFSVDCKSVADVAELPDDDETIRKPESTGYDDDEEYQLDLLLKHLIETFLYKKEHQLKGNEDFIAKKAEHLLNRFTRGSRNQRFWKRNIKFYDEELN